MDDYEVDYDESCPKCNHSPIHWRRCSVIGCDDGWIDLYEFDDPLLFDPGDVERCQECRGTGIERWCPGCGANLSGVRAEADSPGAGEGASLEAETRDRIEGLLLAYFERTSEDA